MKVKSHRWSVLGVAGAGQFLVLLESTVITVAIPPIGASLEGGEWVSWVLSGYLLAFGAFLLPGGAWADRYGQRRVFLVGLVGFMVSSALCALAPSIQLLVAARAVQGASAGVLAASALGVVLTRYTGARERAIAMTAWSTLGVIGAVVGSLAAGPLIAWLDWPGVFWINVVAVAVLLPVAGRVIPRAESPRSSGRVRVGAAFVGAAGTALVLTGLSVAETRPLVGAAVAVVGVIVVSVVVRRQMRAPVPVLPVGLFRLSAYRVSAAGLFLANGIMIAAMFAYSQHLQDGYGLSATTASFAVLPMALASLVTAFATDAVIARVGETATLRAGAALLLAGIVVVLTVSVAGASWGWLIGGGVLLGSGLPACFVVLNRRAFGAVDPAESGAASGFTNTLTTIGGATLVSLTALGHTLAGHTGGYLALLLAALVLAALAMERFLTHRYTIA